MLLCFHTQLSCNAHIHIHVIIWGNVYITCIQCTHLNPIYKNEVNQTLQTCTLHDVCIRTLLMSTISNPLLIHPYTHMYTPHTQCTHTHTCTCMSIHAHTCICTRTHTHAHTHTHTRARTRLCTRAHAHTHARTHTHTHACICTGRQTDRQTGRQTDRQTDTQTHTHTDTHTEGKQKTCAFCSMVALRKAGLNNKKQRGESCLVSCFISTSNTLAMKHPAYHDMKGWGKDKQSHDCPLSSTFRYCHTSICIVEFRKIGQQK